MEMKHSSSPSVSEMLSNPSQFGLSEPAAPVDKASTPEPVAPKATPGIVEGENEPELSTEAEASTEDVPEAKTEEPSTVEYITVTDDKGRRKIAIDFSDKEKLKKLASMAYGANKWKVERDNLVKELEKSKGVASKSSELEENWNVLESTFKKEGIEGLVDLLQGKRGAYKEHLQQQMEKQKFLERASPEELKLFQEQEDRNRLARELEEERRANQEFRQRYEAEKEANELAALSGIVHPTFEKYRFAGKLGNADDEQMFDEVLWGQMQKHLAPYEEKGVAITRELVDSTLKNISGQLRKRLAAQTERKVSKVIEQKKQEAAESAQSATKAAYRPQSETAKEAMGHIQGGSLSNLFSNWNKYKGSF